MNRPAGSFSIFQNKAIDLYKAGNYGSALKAVDAAFELAGRKPQLHEPASLLTLVELKAKIYEKTGNLKAAQKHAKDMIVTQRHDPRGYLRYGKLCILLGDLQSALRVYQQGIKRCSDTQQLVEMQKKIQKRIEASSTRRDPLQSLPLEVLQLVFQHLSFRQLVRCQRVNKTWMEALRSGLLSRFALMDLSSKSELRKDTLRSALRLGPCRGIRWDQIRKQDEVVCMRLLSGQEWIEHISGGTVNRTPVDYVASLDFKRLRTLRLRITVGPVILDDLLAHLPNLEVLDLTMATSSFITHGRPPDAAAPEAVRGHDKLRTLSLASAHGFLNVYAGSLASYCEKLPELRDLRLQYICALEGSLMEMLSHKTLTRFHYYANRSDLVLPVVMGSSAHLEDLVLHGIRDLKLAGECKMPSLRSLRISNSRIETEDNRGQVALAGLSAIVDSLGIGGNLLTSLDLSESAFTFDTAALCPKLAKVNLRRCFEIGDLHAKALAAHHTGLAEVDVSYTQVGDMGLSALVKAGVTRLGFLECPVSTETYQWLSSQSIQTITK